MNEKLLSVCISTLILLIVFNSGCIFDENKKTNASTEKIPTPIYTNSDTWSTKSTDSDGKISFMNYTISSVSTSYNGKTAIKRSITYFMNGFTENNGNVWSDWTGTGFDYITPSYPAMQLYIELDMTSKVKMSGSSVWHNTTTQLKTTYTYTGDAAEKPAVGDTWSLKVTKTDTKSMGFDGNRSTNTTTETETRNYEILDTEPIGVGAGNFECFKLKYDFVKSNRYTLQYYSSDAKINVRELGYNGTKIESRTELVAYTVS